MPTASKVRFVNIRYNDDKRIIPDVTLDLKNDKTLALLQNTGGKSVLTNFLSQPILFCHDRLKKGDETYFDMNNYFKTNTQPGYVFLELELEDNNGYLLVGVGFKKTTDNILKKVAFIREYSNIEDKYSIKNFPFFDTSNGFKQLNGIDELYSKFTNDRKNTEVLCYRSNNNTHKQRFKEKLLEYRINESEWRNVYARVNASEGGMSELFKKSKTSQDLLNDWIIPNIEDKLSKDCEDGQDKITDIKLSVDKYINEKNSRMEELKNLDELREFLDDINEIAAVVEKRESNEQLLVEAKSNLANIHLELNVMNNNILNKEALLKECIKDSKAREKDLRYKKLSLDIQGIKKNIDDLSSELNNINTDVDEIIKAEADSENMVNAIECARQYEDYQMNLANIERLNEKLKPLSVKLEQLESRTNNIKYSLKCIYTNKIEELNLLLTDLECKQSNDSARQDVIAKELTIINDALQECIKSIKGVENNIAVFNNLLTRYKNNYSDFNIELDVYSKLFNANELKDYKEILDAQIIDEEANLQDKRESLSNNKIREQFLITEIRKNEKEIYALETSKDNVERELAEFLQIRNNILDIMDEFDLYKNDLYNKESLRDSASYFVKEYKDLIEKLIVSNSDLKKTIALYKSSRINIDEGVKKILTDNGVNFIYGLEYLKNINKPYSEKLMLLEKNPLLPYSLIVDKRDLLLAEKILYKQFTNNVVPIIVKQDIDDVMIARENSVIKINNVNFFVGYNEELIDDAHIKDVVKSLEDTVATNEYNIGEYNKKVDRLSLLNSLLNEFTWTKDSELSLEEEIATIADKIYVLEYDNDSYESESKAIIENNKELENAIKQIEYKLSKTKLKVSDFEELLNNYTVYKNAIELYEVKETEKDEYGKKKQELEVEKNKIFETLTLNKAQQKDLKGQIESLSKEKHEFIAFEGIGEILRFENGVLMDAKTLEDLLVETKNSGEFNDINLIEDEKKRYEQNAAYIKEYLDNSDIDESIYKNITYSNIIMQEAKEQLKDIRNKHILLSEKKSAKAMKLELEEKRFDKKVADCKNKFNCTYHEGFITKIDFYKEIELEKATINAKELELSECYIDKKKINNMLKKSEQYKEFSISPDIELELITYDNYEYVFENYKEIVSETVAKITSNINRIDILLRNANSKYATKYNNEYISKVIVNLMEIHLTKANLDIYMSRINAQISLLEGSEKRLEKQLEAIVMLVTAHANKLYEELKQIDKNSTLQGKKLFKIILPKECNEHGVREFLIDLISVALSDISKKDRLLTNKITSYNILNAYIGLDKVKIKLVKFNARGVIKENVDYEDTHEGGECSGAQRTIIALIILQAILDYTNDKIIADNKKISRFIFLDNPFAKITTSDFLEVFFDIAEKFKMQMFCFTDISKPAVIKQFDNIIVMHIVPRGKNEYIEIEQDGMINEILSMSEFSDSNDK